MNMLLTFCVWLLRTWIAVIGIGTAWVLWRGAAHAVTSVRRRLTPRIPAPKPLPPVCPELQLLLDEHIESELRRLDGELRDDPDLCFDVLDALFADDTTDH